MSLTNPEPESGDIMNEIIATGAKIDRGEGLPEDLERHLTLGGSYYRSKTAEEGARENSRATVGLTRESLRFNRALETGLQGRLQFCNETIAFMLEAATRMDENGSPETADRYRRQAQNWAKLMGFYQSSDIKSQ